MKRRTFLKLATGSAIASCAVVGGGTLFLHQAAFGALPKETSAILNSPHYGNGVFHNTLPTPMSSNSSGGLALSLIRSCFVKKENSVPPCPIPSVRHDLKALETPSDLVIWFGHSSFFVQLDGVRFLIDPVFSLFAAPVSFSTKAFPGTTRYTVADMPYVDCVLISHDHWDHLDYPTVMGLKDKIGCIICPLGVGAHFRCWGFAEGRVREADWGEYVEVEKGLRVYVAEARHYSGRSLVRNKTLWGGFLLESSRRKIFYSGDSGYGAHFAELGRTFGGVDLALLDCGQYNERWRHIHMTPEDAVRAAEDMGSRALLPAHIGKFSLAYHAWDEPFRRVAAAAQGRNFCLLTPRIGDRVSLAERFPEFPLWWESMNEEQITV